MVMPDEFDEILIKLRNLEVEIVDQPRWIASNNRGRRKRKTRRAWTSWMIRCACISSRWPGAAADERAGSEISKRIEVAENELKRIIYGFGFAGKEHIALAEKLISEPPKERFDRVVVTKD